MKLKKLTLEVPQELIDRATAVSGTGITPTVRRGLELVAAAGAYAKLRKLRGTVKFSLDCRSLRSERSSLVPNSCVRAPRRNWRIP